MLLRVIRSHQKISGTPSGHANAPVIIDVRRPDAYEQSPHLLPGAVWRDAAKARQWAAEFDMTHPIVVACKALATK